MYHTFGGRCCMVSMSVLIAVGGLKIPHGFRVNCFSILKASKIWLAFVAFWAGRVSKNSSYESHAGFSREPNGFRHPNRFVVLSKMAWDIFNVFSFVFFSLLGKGWMFYRFGIPMLKNSECSTNWGYQCLKTVNVSQIWDRGARMCYSVGEVFWKMMNVLQIWNPNVENLTTRCKSGTKVP